MKCFFLLDLPCTEILDADWLSTIDSIVITGFVFLLGVPLLIFQTFLPEGVKDVFNKRNFIVRDFIVVGVLGIIAAFLVFYYGNHAQKQILIAEHKKDYLLNPTAHENSCCVPFDIVNFYTTGFVLVVLFAVLSVGYFAWKIFSARQLRGRIVKHLVYKTVGLTWTWVKEWKLTRPIYLRRLKKRFAEGVPDDVVDDFSIMGKSANLPVHKGIVIRGLKRIVDYLCQFESGYKGESMNGLIDRALLETICHHPEHCNRKNFRDVLEIAETILKHNNESFDASEVGTLLIKLARHAHEANFKREYMRSVMLLFSMPKGNIECFKLARYAWENNDLTSVIEEVFAIRKLLLNNDPTNLNIHFNNLCAYLSWFYHKNEEGRKFVLRYIQKLIPINTIDTKNVYLARTYFSEELVDFDAAESIVKMERGIFK
jgi:hypothetical protein